MFTNQITGILPIASAVERGAERRRLWELHTGRRPLKRMLDAMFHGSLRITRVLIMDHSEVFPKTGSLHPALWFRCLAESGKFSRLRCLDVRAKSSA